VYCALVGERGYFCALLKAKTAVLDFNLARAISGFNEFIVCFVLVAREESKRRGKCNKFMTLSKCILKKMCF
jgi:hypothetical protein